MRILQYLVNLLGLLSTEEINTLKEGLASREDAKSRIISLLEMIIQNTSLSINELEETLINTFFIKAASPNIQLRNLINRAIIGEVEGFIAQLQVRNDKQQQSRLVLEFVSQRSTFEMYPTLVKRFQKKNQQRKQRDINYYQEQLYYAYQAYWHPSTQQPPHHKLFHSADEQLEQYHLVLKMKFLCEAKCRQETLNEDFKTENLPYFLSLAAQHSPTENAIGVYYFIFQLLNGDKKLSMDKVVGYFKQIRFLFSKKEQVDVLIFLMNYVNYQFNGKRNEACLNTLLQICELRLSEDLKNIIIHSKFFILTIQLFLNANRKEQALSIIQNYHQRLPSHLVEDTVTFCNGIIHLDEKNYSKAQYIFSQVSRTDAQLYMMAMMYQTRSMVEAERPFKLLSDIRYIMSHCNKILNAVKQLPLGKIAKHNTSNFIKFLRIGLSKRNFSWSAQLNKLKETPNVAFKSWLVEIFKERANEKVKK